MIFKDSFDATTEIKLILITEIKKYLKGAQSMAKIYKSCSPILPTIKDYQVKLWQFSDSNHVIQGL